MSSTLLKTTVIGNVGESRKITHGGDTFLAVTVAVDSPVKGEPPEWVELILGQGYMNLEPYLVKGKRVYAEGRSRSHMFKKQDGSPGFITKVRVRDINLL